MKSKQQVETSNQKQRGGFSAFAPWLLVLAGILLLGRPVFLDWYAAWQAEQQIHEITSAYDDTNNPERLENLAQAQAYNAKMAGREYEEPEGGIWDYERQLTYKGSSGSMASWIDIPRISTKFPIYHGTGEAALMVGVGHCDWSALPVGGEGTRCVLTGHSGMTNTRMFDDIRALEKGDQFVIWTLGEPYAYEVYDIQTVLPEDAATYCKPVEGKDLTTLITCTPYGINTHRLLVTGERCEYEGVGTIGIEAYVNRRTIPMLAGIAVLLLLVLFVLLFKRRRDDDEEEDDEEDEDEEEDEDDDEQGESATDGNEA